MKLALGTVQIGTRYGIRNSGRPSLKESQSILNTALKLGIRTFDTAAAYGDSEYIIGSFIENGAERDTVEIITKLRPNVLDGRADGEYEEIIGAEILGSLSRLQINRLDGLLFHNESYVYNEQAMEALAKCKKSGLVKRTGISVYTPEAASEALKYDIDILQAPYNVLDRRFEQSDVFEAARKNGVTVFARSPLLQGMLVMPVLPARMEFAALYINEYRSACEKLGMTLLQCAIGFAVRCEHADFLLFGVDNIEQLYEIVLAAEKPMDEDKYEYLCGKFLNVPEKVVRPDMWKG